MHTLKLKIPIKKPKTIYKAIKPELKFSPTQRSEIKIKPQKKSLCLKINSRDLSSFRAAMNSWLRWIQVAKEINEIKKKV